jgi:hypothetical protein
MTIDTEAFKQALDDNLQHNEDAFKGIYRVQLHELRGLSDEEIAEVCPSATASQDFAKLVAVVSEASRKNLSQADLANQIKSLGANAVKIAKLVGGLAAVFA